MGHADIAYAAFLLPFAQVAELGPPVHQAVDLHQIQGALAEEFLRAAHLFQAGVASGGAHLGGDEQVFRQVKIRHQITDYRLGVAIDRRGIDQCSAEFVKPEQHVAENIQVCFVGHFELVGRPEANHRQRFLRPRDSAVHHAGARREREIHMRHQEGARQQFAERTTAGVYGSTL